MIPKFLKKTRKKTNKHRISGVQQAEKRHRASAKDFSNQNEYITVSFPNQNEYITVSLRILNSNKMFRPSPSPKDVPLTVLGAFKAQVQMIERSLHERGTIIRAAWVIVSRKILYTVLPETLRGQDAHMCSNTLL